MHRVVKVQWHVDVAIRIQMGEVPRRKRAICIVGIRVPMAGDGTEPKQMNVLGRQNRPQRLRDTEL